MARPGTFLAFEGIDGAGTTSQMAPIASFLRRQGHEVVATCEPSTLATGELLRACLRGTERLDETTLALLFAADRSAHLQHAIEPALRRGAIVLCDRYLWSSYAYQSTSQPPLPLAWLRAINQHARPADWTAYFDLSTATAARRRALRGQAADHFERAERQRLVAQAYRALFADATAKKSAPCVCIDAEASLGEVTQQLEEALSAFLLAHRPA